MTAGTDRTCGPRGRRRIGVCATTIAMLTVVVLSACTASPARPVSGTGRPDQPGPPEITASARNSRLPAGTPGRGTPTVVIGTKDFSEQFLLGELYTQALRAKGYTVSLAPNVGDSENIDLAFASNRVDMYPEYLGEIAPRAAGEPGPGSPLGTYQQALQYERTRRAATLLFQTPYKNTDVLVVRRDLAVRYGLRSVSDLANLGTRGDGVRVAAQPPFRTRANGLVGLQQSYGLTGVTVLAVAPGETYSALDAGQVQVADGFSTDAQLYSGDYVALSDPMNIFGFQYVAPVVKQSALASSGPAFAETCNWVSALLTTDSMREMNRSVQLDGAEEATVAHDFLIAHGLR